MSNPSLRFVSLHSFSRLYSFFVWYKSRSLKLSVFLSIFRSKQMGSCYFSSIRQFSSLFKWFSFTMVSDLLLLKLSLPHLYTTMRTLSGSELTCKLSGSRVSLLFYHKYVYFLWIGNLTELAFVKRYSVSQKYVLIVANILSSVEP